MFPLKRSNIFNRLSGSRVLDSQQLWAYVAIAFNKVDFDRLKLVGPDRLCAEWVLKNGGGVSFVHLSHRVVRDYNTLPPESDEVAIKVIDATDSSIMKLGLEHLRSCKHIEKVILNRCKHLERDGLEGLAHIRKTLTCLQVSSCHNINDKGLMPLKNLTNLKTLIMFDLESVKHLNKVAAELQSHLTGCNIDTTKRNC